jgi:hypothetical protein
MLVCVNVSIPHGRVTGIWAIRMYLAASLLGREAAETFLLTEAETHRTQIESGAKQQHHPFPKQIIKYFQENFMG